MHPEQLWEESEEESDGENLSDAAEAEGFSPRAPTYTGKGKGRAN
jgi:hypothetical protein